MKLKQAITILMVIAFGLLLVACAGSGEQEAEAVPETVSEESANGSGYSIEETEQAIASAEQAINKARSHGGDPSQQALMLEDARLAMEAEDQNRATELAMAAEHGANQIYNDALLAKARELVDKVGNSNVAGSDEVMERISEVEIAYQIGDGELAYEKATALYDDTLGVAGQSEMALPEEPEKEMQPQPEMVASSEPIPLETDNTLSGARGSMDKYTVERGDSLWTISAKPAIYSNPYQWPLIYKTNKHQIKDPDLIHPGQNLDIEQNVTTAEVEAAVSHARNRGKWILGEVEASDTRYLQQSERSAVASR